VVGCYVYTPRHSSRWCTSLYTHVGWLLNVAHPRSMCSACLCGACLSILHGAVPWRVPTDAAGSDPVTGSAPNRHRAEAGTSYLRDPHAAGCSSPLRVAYGLSDVGAQSSTLCKELASR
jgi:hypothetical protein